LKKNYVRPGEATTGEFAEPQYQADAA
jgi:hypothetical protein